MKEEILKVGRREEEVTNLGASRKVMKKMTS